MHVLSTPLSGVPRSPSSFSTQMAHTVHGNLPSDVWIEVSQRSSPRDVFSLMQVRSRSFHSFQGPVDTFRSLTFSQASKHLYSVLNDKGVWVKILRTTCIKESLFQPSYPIDDMTLQEVQRASLAPSHWRHRITSGIIQSNLATFYASLDPPHKCRNTPHTQGNAVLIPGGRYLISIPHGNNLEIYDLGVSGRPILEGLSPIFRMVGEKAPYATPVAVAPLSDAVVRVVIWSREVHWQCV